MKRLSVGRIIPAIIIVVPLIIGCSKGIDEREADSSGVDILRDDTSLDVQDTIPGDTLPWDTIPGDTLPGDTIQGDTII